jgi:hypothetical protein
MIAEQTKPLDHNAAAIPLEKREELAMMLAATFKEFTDFADLGMRYLGFNLSPMQRDMLCTCNMAHVSVWYKHNGVKLNPP